MISKGIIMVIIGIIGSIVSIILLFLHLFKKTAADETVYEYEANIPIETMDMNSTKTMKFDTEKNKSKRWNNGISKNMKKSKLMRENEDSSNKENILNKSHDMPVAEDQAVLHDPIYEANTGTEVPLQAVDETIIIEDIQVESSSKETTIKGSEKQHRSMNGIEETVLLEEPNGETIREVENNLLEDRIEPTEILKTESIK
ncbi:hypothetical protein ACTQ5K_09650 [Niallia sp. Sow4_A1]|uniref:hypothetical protein n=1 Tax=Niallia sp. Sow4_A1 TaxID=3438793 RepID=UPI003F959ACF